MKDLSVQYYNLNELSDPLAISKISQAVLDQLDRGNVDAIAKAFYLNTKICVNGIPYIKVSGIADIIRTGNSGLERALIYQGVAGILAKSEVISIDGFDHISGPSLVAILDTRIAFKVGKTKQYLMIALSLYNTVLNNPGVRDLKEMFVDEIEKRRPGLKSERIKTFSITHCELTNTLITDLSQVQFAHIDSVVYQPAKALDISNGIIILKNIHSDMTRRGINSYEEMYQYCLDKGYSTQWAL